MVTITELVEPIIRALVDDPFSVQFSTVETDTSCVVDVTAPEAELGRLIGRQGNTINAIRALARVLGAKQGRRVTINIAALGAPEALVE